MIDKENEVFTRIHDAIVEQFPTASIDSAYQAKPSGFPHVSFYQSDAYTPQELLDSSYQPKYVALTFEAQVYSNKTKTKKQECKKIMSIIVDRMAEMNFRLSVLTPVQNLQDSSIYRLTARFEGMADANGFYER